MPIRAPGMGYWGEESDRVGFGRDGAPRITRLHGRNTCGGCGVAVSETVECSTCRRRVCIACAADGRTCRGCAGGDGRG